MEFIFVQNRVLETVMSLESSISAENNRVIRSTSPNQICEFASFFFFCNLFIFIFILLQKVTILKILDLQCLNHLTEKGNNNTHKTLLGMTYLKKKSTYKTYLQGLFLHHGYNTHTRRTKIL